ncbi:hypothetical protein K8089_08505 [Aequorivita sp. F47161]|uniref:Uncharacterized protein n=1 Tax=Aequorivita vitellina TaxID=2874475 RepID=A0A9X1QXA5_9FLAO|nr:hypothetical protein [Aequorivita vitellina]MCG2419062.1 hypothetical protein [Aequorivita vitellina]
MKHILTFFIMVFFISGSAQVGIGTVDPKSDLHIVKTADNDGGSIQIDGGIRLGGTETTQGSKGKAGQVIMSNGTTAGWVTLGKAEGYITNCDVPNKVAFIDINLPNGSPWNEYNVSSAQMTTALNSLTDGGIVALRTNSIVTYTSGHTRLTITLPKTTDVLNKPFVITFDGPSGSNNLLGHNSIIRIIVKPNANEPNSLIYELGGNFISRTITIESYPSNNEDYKVSDLDNDSGSTQPILLFNSYTIKAINTKTWAFTNRDCYVQNPTQ